MYSLLLTFKSMEVDHEVNVPEKALLMVNGLTGATVRPRPPSAASPGPGSWLGDASWARISELTDLDEGPWVNFSDSFAENIAGWKKVFDSDEPFAAPWPQDIKAQMSPLQKSLLLLAVRTDQTIKGLQEIILAKLGKDYLEPPSFNLDLVYSDSTNTMPLIFVLSSGADPMGELIRLATKWDMVERKIAVSLGQGQGKKAEAAMREGKDNGMWVILQNCHLSVSWMPRLEALVEELDPDKLDQEFRLWLTTMPSAEFPVSVLQNGSKMTVEPPKGLKSNLLRAFGGLDKEWYEDACQTSKACTQAFRKMLFGLFFFHGLIQERCNFGPLGWNIMYQFSEPDRQICTDQLKIFLEEQDPVIPYKALCYTCSECNYGGRVTDADDRVTISMIITDFYTDKILDDDYKFSPSGVYYSPKHTNHEGYMQYIRTLPINQNPEMFGLHENANLTCAIKEVLNILATANSMSGSGGSAEGGKSPDEILATLGSKYLSDVLPPFDTEATVAKYPVDYTESLNTVLNQELLRFNKLILRVRDSLSDVCKAVKGLVVMDSNLDEVATGILKNTRPPFWMKVSYPSLKPLSGYVADLVARIKFFTDWEHGGHPEYYWISGFYFTQSFLTGQLQNFARKGQLAIDTLGWMFTSLKKAFGDELDIIRKPDCGCYVFGLFMEGARWDDLTGHIEESIPKVLFETIPFMHWIPLERSKDPTDFNRVYNSPLYKTSERKGVLATTGHSSNRVMTLLLAISERHSDKYWNQRGVCVLTQLDD
jgi:dynein heavy chain